MLHCCLFFSYKVGPWLCYSCSCVQHFLKKCKLDISYCFVTVFNNHFRLNIKQRRSLSMARRECTFNRNLIPFCKYIYSLLLRVFWPSLLSAVSLLITERLRVPEQNCQDLFKEQQSETEELKFFFFWTTNHNEMYESIRTCPSEGIFTSAIRLSLHFTCLLKYLLFPLPYVGSVVSDKCFIAIVLSVNSFTI